MTPDEYVRSVLVKYDLPAGPDSPAEKALRDLVEPIRNWAGRYFLAITPTGSYAKGTRVLGGTDLDIMISLDSRTPLDAAQLYEHFFRWLQRHDFHPRRQPVSIGITHHGLTVDLIPAKKTSELPGDHQLYETNRRRITNTNIDTHVRYVVNSRRADEIRAIKIWRTLRELRFPSFYLELAVTDALRQRPHDLLAGNVETVLRYLHRVFPGVPFLDPANHENRISDGLLEHEKLAIAESAEETLAAEDWAQVIR